VYTQVHNQPTAQLVLLLLHVSAANRSDIQRAAILGRHVQRTLQVDKYKSGLPRKAKVAQGVPGRLRPRIFLTFRHYKGGRSSAIRTGRLYPRRDPWYSLPEAESTSGHLVLSGVPRKKSSVTPLGIDPGTSRLVSQHLNHYATPGPDKYK